MNTNLTKEQKIDALQHDFLDRDQNTFVKIRRSNRLGWESMIPAGGSYSDIFRSEKCEDVILEAYRMARDYIVAMDTPYRVTLRLSPERNCTDSKVVYLMTRMFDDESITVGQQVDTFVGLAIHEGCHLKYTDFTQMAGARNRIVAKLINLIEDERIERLCGEQMPGYANFLTVCKYYMFSVYSERQTENAEKKGEKLSDGARLFNAILSIIRYPKSIIREDLEEFADYLYDVREVIIDFPKTSQQVTDAANAIYDIIRKFFEHQKQSSDSKSKGGEELGKLEEQLAEDLSDLVGEPDASQSPIDREDMGSAVKKDCDMLAGLCENTVTIGNTSSAVLYKAPEDGDLYGDSLNRVRKYIPAISKALKGHCCEYGVIYRGMRSGTLDTSKIAEAYQGVQNVYVREGKIKSDKMAVCVLIDESGSMSGEKIEAARDLAVLLKEAIGAIPLIDLYIYGHTHADRCEDSYREGRRLAELQIYHEKGYTPKHALGSVYARSGNLDSVAIREAASRMRRISNCRQNLMFVITDGAPNESCQTLADTVKKVEKEGVNIVAVCIEPHFDPSELYTHCVTFKNMNTLAIDLGKMIKRTILRRSNRTCV